MKGLLLGLLLCTVIVGSERKRHNRMRRRGLLLKSTSPVVPDGPTRTTLKTARYKRDYDFDFEGTLNYDSEAEDNENKNAVNGRRKREIATDYVNKPPKQVDNRLRLTQGNEQELETDKHRRSLRSGDYFTVQELLPVTRKLTAKVEHPGQGNGIVTSAGSPEMLAERLFRAFFNTEKQIIVLKDSDISALDALQALALNEDEVPNAFDKNSGVILVPDDLVNDAIPFKAAESRFKLLSKKLDDAEIQAIDNIKPKEWKAYQKVSPKPSSSASTSKAPVCRWRYKCTDPADLDTCDLFTRCDIPRPAAAIRRYHEKNEEKEKLVAEFRKMMKFTILDEEVEKILEARFLYLRSKKQESPERQPNLRDYFKTLNMRQHSTTKKARLALVDDDNLYGKDYVAKLEDTMSKKTNRRHNLYKKRVAKIIEETRKLQKIQGKVKIRPPKFVTKPILITKNLPSKDMQFSM